MPQAKVTENILIEFCKEFIESPYLCYTEHGLHVRFITQLSRAFEANGLERETAFDERPIGLIQKEYPTNHHFGKSRRQNWDVSVIKNPIEPPAVVRPYDHLHLAAVVEFGLNYGATHLTGDLTRLTHPDSNVSSMMIAHLYRLSTAGNQISRRDISPNAAGILSVAQVQAIAAAFPAVTVFYAMADMTGTFDNGSWRITPNGPQLI